MIEPNADAHSETPRSESNRFPFELPEARHRTHRNLSISKGPLQMKLASIVFICLIVSFEVAGQVRQAHAFEVAGPATADSPVEEVKASIKKMIVLIDEHNTLELLEKYTDVPADARKKIAERIDQDKLDELKKYLGIATKMTPKVTDEGKTVVFENEEFPRPMKFIKSGESWVMKDK